MLPGTIVQVNLCLVRRLFSHLFTRPRQKGEPRYSRVVPSNFLFFSFSRLFSSSSSSCSSSFSWVSSLFESSVSLFSRWVGWILVFEWIEEEFLKSGDLVEWSWWRCILLEEGNRWVEGFEKIDRMVLIEENWWFFSFLFFFNEEMELKRFRVI